MSFLKNPGTVVLFDPFDITRRDHFLTYVETGVNDGLTVYYNVDQPNTAENCFIASVPYQSYRIMEHNVLLKPDPSACFGKGIVWSGSGYYMYMNHENVPVITGDPPGVFPNPEDFYSIRDIHWQGQHPSEDYWKLEGFLPGDILIGKHCSDGTRNITVKKEFPRWVRREGVADLLADLPCGYYDPVDGAKGTIRIGTPLENGSYTGEFDKKETDSICYVCEAMTWK